MLIYLKGYSGQFRGGRSRKGEKGYCYQAEGEKQASEKLAEAASVLGASQGGLFIRLCAPFGIASQPGNIIAFPLPMELRYLADSLNQFQRAGGEGDVARSEERSS